MVNTRRINAEEQWTQNRDASLHVTITISPALRMQQEIAKAVRARGKAFKLTDIAAVFGLNVRTLHEARKDDPVMRRLVRNLGPGRYELDLAAMTLDDWLWLDMRRRGSAGKSAFAKRRTVRGERGRFTRA